MIEIFGNRNPFLGLPQSTWKILMYRDLVYWGYGSFTLPDTETDNETHTDRMCTEPMEICIGLSLGPL